MAINFAKFSDEANVENYAEDELPSEEYAQSVMDEEKEESPTNMSSLILLFHPKGRNILLSGDACSATLKDAVEAYPQSVPVCIFKVPHHGSKHNLTTEVIEIRPSSAVISCKGTKKHPNPAVVHFLSRYCDVFSTSKSNGGLTYTNGQVNNPATALKKDFPIELPHSNAKPFSRPVSPCVSDVTFTDIRPQFNAYDFLNYIRRWFSLNSINKLHKADRPLEVFFGFHEVCCILNERSDANPYVRYSRKTKLSSTLEFVDKSQATHYLINIPTEKVYASNFVRIPQTLGNLKTVQSSPQLSLTDRLFVILEVSVAGKASLPIAILVFITQISEDNKKTSHNLFLNLKMNTSPQEIVHKRCTLNQSQFEQWFYGFTVDVLLLDVMVSRDSNALNNGIKDTFKKVGIIGTGTLDSAVIDHFVREGCSEVITIVDYDILFPHNLSRHTLTTDKVMISKVHSIKEAYRGILFQKLTAIEGNFLTLSKNDKDRFVKDTQLIMNFSTSVAVERSLAKEESTCRRCTSFLNPKGDEIILLMEDIARKHRLDLLEMDYYRNLIVDERFFHHLDQTETVRTNNFSCRSESMILNYENVRILSAIVSNQIRKYYTLVKPV